MNDSVIAGALFDFMAWLTTRDERLVLSAYESLTHDIKENT